ncbi:metallophosphoesterase, partial [bacterium]|nr:metallophosphoesterase [bacterium]
LPVGCSKGNQTPLWKTAASRDKIVVISDLHLGIEDEYTETLKNRPLLIEFLQRLQKTSDVRELVIAGDFLDTWYLPVYYPQYTDENKFYRDVIANNQAVIDEFNNVIASGIKVVYVPGNHDMTLEADVLQEAMPNIIQARDAKGLGTYYTGDRNEIVIEHGHRYDAFSAPDTFTNKELCGNDDTILPAGYIYARYGATWMLEDCPKVEKNLPEITIKPDQSDVDQYSAYVYYEILKDISTHITPNEGLDEKIFDIRVAGFNDKYSYLDFYPIQQEDGTISAPVLFKNIQRTWGDRQNQNNVKVKSTFIEAALGALDYTYFFDQAKKQYLENPDENVDVVIFGHTHMPSYKTVGEGKRYLNAGTWVDHNNVFDKASCTFAVVSTGETNTSGIYSYSTSGAVSDILPLLD